MNNNDTTIQEIETSIALVKKDVENFSHLFNKLEAVVGKMGEVSNNINRLLSVHDQKLETLDDKMEKSSGLFQTELKELHNHIRSNNRDIMEKLRSSEESINNNLKYVRETLDRENKILRESIDSDNKLFKESIDRENTIIRNSIISNNQRISALERWRWIVIGGAAVLYFVVNKTPFSLAIVS
jgi:hypothetical protein